MLKVGQTGYTVAEALAELVDNALDARLPDQKLLVKIHIDATRISIEDNGQGMTETEAMNAMRLGFSNKANKLGEFGMGLKAAATFLGKTFTIKTTALNNTEKYTIRFNEEEWLESGDWNRYAIRVAGGFSATHSGTVIEITDLRNTIDEKLVKLIRKEFSVRFGPFVEQDELALSINDKYCEPQAPTLIGEKNVVDIETDMFHIKGWWGYQLRGLNKYNYGFHTYRRGRLITVFDKMGLSPNQDLKQIIGELSIEGIDVSHDKRSWQTGTDAYKAMVRKLREYFAPLEKRPRRILSGYPASGGLIEGKVKVVSMLMESDLAQQTKEFERGSILVTDMTRPQYLLLIRRAGAIVTDLGGSLSHAAVVAREFNIPAVVGTKHGKNILRDGQAVIVDGHNGIIYEV